MRMDLGFCLGTTMDQTEGTDCPIQIFRIPVRTTQWQFFAKRRLIYLDHRYSVFFQIKHFIADCQRNLISTFFQRNILSRERPIEYRNRTCKHALHRLIRKALCIYRPGYRHRFFPRNIAPNDWRFYTSCSIGLHPCFLCKQISFEIFSKIFHHIISLIFAVNQHIQPNFFLQSDAFCNLFAVKCDIFFFGNFFFAICCSRCFHIRCLRERSNRSCWKQWKRKSFFLYLFAFFKRRQSGKIFLFYFRNTLLNRRITAVSCLCKQSCVFLQRIAFFSLCQCFQFFQFLKFFERKRKMFQYLFRQFPLILQRIRHMKERTRRADHNRNIFCLQSL